MKCAAAGARYGWGETVRNDDLGMVWNKTGVLRPTMHTVPKAVVWILYCTFGGAFRHRLLYWLRKTVMLRVGIVHSPQGGGAVDVGH